MIRTALATIAIVVLISTCAIPARAQQDFAGSWERVSEQTMSTGFGPYASSLTIEQTPTTITLGLLTAFFSSGSNESFRREVVTPVTYTTDGADHELILERPESTGAATGRSTVATIRTAQQRAYRALWNASQLIIVTHETSTLSVRDKAPLTIRRTIRDSLTIGSDGLLTVERIAVGDPIPAGYYFSTQTETTPAPVRTVYRRRN